MALKCGIIGLPNVGKSTLFNCLSNAKAQAANFPFCTVQPNIGVITVPDERLNVLSQLSKSRQMVPATVDIVDIAGLVQGASKGEGLGNQFLGNIRECDAVLHVVRCFEDDNIAHVDGSVHPIRDKEIIDTELQLKDLETIENLLVKIEKQSKVGNDRSLLRRVEIAKQIRDALSEGQSARTLEWSAEDKPIVREFQLLTQKPVLYVCNVGEQDLRTGGNAHTEVLANNIRSEKAEFMILAAQAEAEIAELKSSEDRAVFLEDLGLKEPVVNVLIRKTHHLLGLQTYFTSGEQETRAWTFPKGCKAPQAAGIIHTDFEKGFIRAEVIKYNDFIEFKSELACREAGKMAVEGKEYIVQDGDIIHFRFNV